ncbi:MAG: hypothetical protein EA413_08580, partial [Cyanobium sp. PLM2.Bin73]
DRKRGWQWVMVTAMVTVFIQGLSRSTAAAIELLGNAFGGIVVSDRFSAAVGQDSAHLPAVAQWANGLWTFLEIEGIEPTNNAAERALRQSVIRRKISHGAQSATGAICRSRLLRDTTTLRQQAQDVWQFLEQAWISHHRGGVMPSLLPDP